MLKRLPTRRHRRARGVTLMELMIVVVIISVLSTVGMFSLSGYGNSQNAAALARAIQFSMARARVDAASDGKQRRFLCDKSGCTYQIATTAGKVPGVFLDAGDHIRAGNHAKIWQVTGTTDTAANNAGSTPIGGTATITFLADGSSSGGTVYVSDTSGNTNKNKYKVYVYPGTGLARLVATW